MRTSTSKGYSCCTGRRRVVGHPVLVCTLTLAPLTAPSTPLMSSTTLPNLQSPLGYVTTCPSLTVSWTPRLALDVLWSFLSCSRYSSSRTCLRPWPGASFFCSGFQRSHRSLGLLSMWGRAASGRLNAHSTPRSARPRLTLGSSRILAMALGAALKVFPLSWMGLLSLLKNA